jgi:hypothetical protein
MKDYTLSRYQYEDQVNINAAYADVKDALLHLAQVRELDGELHRLLRSLYTYEDTLYQYVASVEGAKVI